MALTEVLQGILDSLRVQRIAGGTPQPGQLVEVELVPPLTGLSVTDVLTGELDLTWVAKDVLFGTADVEPSFLPADLSAATTRGQPAVTSVGGLVDLPGVPGLLGQLQGSMPLSTASSLPVSASISWQVLDAQGGPLSSDQYSAPGGLTSPRLSVAFVPAFFELGDPVPAAQTRNLRVTVSLSAGGVTVGPRQLPDLSVPVAPLAVPTVLALFLHRDFAARSGSDDGAVLVVVPESSPLGSVEALNPILETLSSVAGALRAITALSGFATGLGVLRSALAQPHGVFRRANRIDNLNEIDLIQRSFFENDTEAEDELSSLILVGRSGRGAHCCNARDLNTGEGDFTVSAGSSLITLVRNLHSIAPAVEFGTLVVGTVPPGGPFQASDFGDSLSSLEFVG